MNTEDVKYVISELRNLHYYDSKIQQYITAINLLEKEMEISSGPHSIQFDRIRAGAMSVHDTSGAEKKLLAIISKQQTLQKDLQIWKNRLYYAECFKNALLSSSEADFVSDYINGASYTELQRKHNVSNAYDRLCRIIKHNVSDSILSGTHLVHILDNTFSDTTDKTGRKPHNNADNISAEEQ